MSDDEMDREWRASRGGSRQRPQSTVARAFSASLDELFKIDNSLADLDASVNAKKQAVSSQETELEALEARLRATEERLKNIRFSISSPSPTSSRSPVNGPRSPRDRPILQEHTFQAPSPSTADRQASPSSPLTQQSHNISHRPRTASRPSTAGKATITQQGQMPPMPGRLPPTPGASEGEDDSSEDSEFEAQKVNVKA